MANKTETTVKVYAEDFKKQHAWQALCNAAGVGANCDYVELKVSKAVACYDEEESDEEEFEGEEL